MTNTYCVHLKAGCLYFPKIQKPPQNFRRLQGDIRKVTHFSLTDIRSNVTNIYWPQRPGFVNPWPHAFVTPALDNTTLHYTALHCTNLYAPVDFCRVKNSSVLLEYKCRWAQNAVWKISKINKPLPLLGMKQWFLGYIAYTLITILTELPWHNYILWVPK